MTKWAKFNKSTSKCWSPTGLDGEASLQLMQVAVPKGTSLGPVG